MSIKKNYHDSCNAEFSELTGKTIFEIVGKAGDETLQMKCSDGSVYQMHYYEDCCARCWLEDIVGDLRDLINSPITMAEESQSEEPSADVIAERKAKYEKEKAEFKPTYRGDEFYWYGPSPDNGWVDESETWTFYRLATVKGYVTLRWHGSSNGYYSEAPTFERLS